VDVLVIIHLMNNFVQVDVLMSSRMSSENKMLSRCHNCGKYFDATNKWLGICSNKCSIEYIDYLNDSLKDNSAEKWMEKCGDKM